MSGTRITCTDVDTGDTDTTVIKDDYCVIVDGNRYVDHLAVHGNGTVVVTIKRRPS